MKEWFCERCEEERKFKVIYDGEDEETIKCIKCGEITGVIK